MSNSKRILIVHRYFYPDTPAYALILKKMAEEWVKEGHSVSVLTTFPSYYGSSINNVKKEENIGGININRIKLFPEKNRNILSRLFNTILFALITYLKILYRKIDYTSY